MALENGMDVKTLSAMIGHVSSETTLNIYSHVTDTMRAQAAGKSTEKSAVQTLRCPNSRNAWSHPRASEPTPTKATPEKEFEPYKGKIRKSGTGCVTMINDHDGSHQESTANAYPKTYTPRHERNARKSSQS